MQARDFCYWLQGALEVNPEAKTLNEDQVEKIKNHLNLVFIHDLDPATADEKLKDIHDGKKDPSRPNLMRC